jgi:hypothetical protein
VRAQAGGARYHRAAWDRVGETTMAAPERVYERVEAFERHREQLKRSAFGETEVRVQFINPLFEALGWDVRNERGVAPAELEVVHEDAVRVARAHKAPDYGFYANRERKFFVEAKKPAVNLRDDPLPAFQLRRYAWSAKLLTSVLTDFEEFVIYDARYQPAERDTAAVARVEHLRYEQYVERWDELAALFSKEAVLGGAIEARFERARLARGAATVDRAFLAEIERWRELLAKNINLRNPGLRPRELNYAVQMTVDRIIFLRMAEDRGIEEYGRLDALRNGGDVYARLRDLYRQADERYNSGLFHFQPERGREGPDDLTPRLTIDDRVLKEILRSLYFPHSPYEFSVLPVDVLGQVYEQFLGKVITIGSRGRVEIEAKPEVRKAGGVYYTPTYIVEYIVAHTVGKLLEGKTPRQARELKIVDPACGSGSFLLGAYAYLLDWYRDRYVANGPERHRKELVEVAIPGTAGQPPVREWRLTTAERKRILLDHIHGVDIDAQAVEVTKLSLLLKLLEGETDLTLNRQLQFAYRERVLPDLDANIKCGNALIGPDFYSNQQMALLPAEDQYRINVFDWQAEFLAITKRGGFDAVIGNPPYIRMEAFKELKEYLRSMYQSHEERADIYAYFIEQSHKLLAPGGRFGMIVSNKFVRANYGKPLRTFLAEHATVERIVDFAGLPVFQGATVRTIVLLTTRQRENSGVIRYSPPLPAETFRAVVSRAVPLDRAVTESSYEISHHTLSQPVWSFARQEEDTLLERIAQKSQRLGEYCDNQIYMGIKSGLTEAFVIDDHTRAEILALNPEAAEIIKPLLSGREIRRYEIEPKNTYIIYTYHGVPIRKYPAVRDHLKSYRVKLERRATKQEWYELQQPQYRFSEFMAQPKIIFPDIAPTTRFALDEAGHYGTNTTYFIPRRDLYLLGLLNSRLGFFYFVKVCAGLEGVSGTYLRFFGQYLEGFPIRMIDFANPADMARQDQMVTLVERMLALHAQLQAARVPQERAVLERQIAATDAQIDRLVYELYGLTGDEIAIVEAGTAR